MSKEEIKMGREWVKQKIYEIGNSFNLKIEDVEWNFDDDSEKQKVEFHIDKKRYIKTFSKEKLEDCVGDKGVRADIEKEILHLIKSIIEPERKIGFSVE